MNSNKKSLNIFLLTMINIATILSIRNWPISAEMGFSSIFYILLASVIFFLPVSFVAAELATGWPEKGGIFVWVKEALGHRSAFLAVWLLWTENVVYYPLLLSFVAGTLAFVFAPQLAHNPLFTFSIIVSFFWLFTLLNLRGMKLSGWISSIGAILGTLIPGVVIVFLGFLWFFSGNPVQVEISWATAFPKITSVEQFTFFAGMILGFAGMEMPAIHANDVENPQKNYPRAIFLSVIVIITLSILGSLAVAFVIPKDEISLTAGSVAVIYRVFTKYQLAYLIPVFALMIMLGALATMSTWIAGPTRGLLAAAEDGDFPPFFHKENRFGMPIVMLIGQAIVVSILALAFFIFPSVSASFWVLAVLSSQLYLIMYALMFISAIVLRYKKPNVERAFRIPGGNLGMWFVAGLGLIGACAVFFVGFFPPLELNFSPTVYVSFLLAGVATFSIIPFLILKFKKPSWKEQAKT